MTLNELAIKTKDKQILIIGELHGSVQTLKLLKKIIIRMQKEKRMLAIGFEWSEKMPLMTRTGKFSWEHLTFIQWLKKKQIPIFSFDVKQTKNREKEMAHQILLFQKRMSKNCLLIILTGNQHAKRQQGQMISYLPNTFSLLLNYKAGYIFANGKKLNVKQANSLKNENHQFYDDVWTILYSNAIIPLFK